MAYASIGSTLFIDKTLCIRDIIHTTHETKHTSQSVFCISFLHYMALPISMYTRVVIIFVRLLKTFHLVFLHIHILCLNVVTTPTYPCQPAPLHSLPPSSPIRAIADLQKIVTQGETNLLSDISCIDRIDW